MSTTASSETQRWEQAILALLEERDAEASICPSEVARRVEPGGWREQMDSVRNAARRLAQRGAVVITQRGKPCEPDGAFRGPIRISIPLSSPGSRDDC